MGYKRKQKIYRLNFEDPELDGLVVDTSGASLEEVLLLDELGDLIVRGAAENLADAVEAMVRVKALFAKHLIAWNLEDDDDIPVPATVEGVSSQDDEFVLDLAMAWVEAVGGVSDPKELTSNDGSPSLVASIPMEPLSPSPGTLSEPNSSSETASDSAVSQAS